MPDTLQITSIHDWFSDDIVAGWHDWKVHSVHERAIILTAGKHLVTLTNAYDGPSTMVTTTSLPSLLPGESMGREIGLDFSSAEPWIPPMFSIIPEEIEEQSLDQLFQKLEYSGRSALLQPKFIPWITRGISALAAGFPRITPDGSVLFGLGPGMTPAGDDFLSGFFHVLYHAGLPVKWDELAPYAAGTNLIAQTMLWWACQGVVAQPFEQALLGLYRCQPNLYGLIQTAFSIGHSSGADHLLGVWLGLLLVKKLGEVENWHGISVVQTN
ncbi:MAG: DUF2877 domain-containing protein [Thermodesulfobacteriota bacterium]|jgi:hypothetical protein